MTDLSSDALRRAVRDADIAQREAQGVQRELLDRLFNDDRVAGIERAELISPLSRRRAVTIGGITVATAAILAACGKKKAKNNIPQTGDPTPLGASPTEDVDDLVLLRTASSLEHVAIDVYDTAIKSGLVKTAAIADAAKMFRDHHSEHAALAEKTTRDLGGEAYTKANTVVWAKVIKPILDGGGLKTEADVVVLAHTLETIAAATYQSAVGLLSLPKLRSAIMTIGGIESRHAAVLAGVIVSAKLVPGSGIFPSAAPAATSTPTTAAEGATPTAPPTTTVSSNAKAVFQVPGAFGAVAAALGPNSYMYYEKVATTTTAPTSTTKA